MSEAGSSSPRRWRLVLGRFAEECLGGCLAGADRRTDAVLEAVYGRAYRDRGIKLEQTRRRSEKSPKGGTEETVLSLPEWTGEMRSLFPKSVREDIQAHALVRFGMKELLADPETLASIDPDPALLGALLSFAGRSDPQTAGLVRQLARRVVEDLLRRLKPRTTSALSGTRRRGTTTSRKGASKDVAWRETIRRNLGNWDPERRLLLVDSLRWNGHVRRRLPWTVVLCIDQSGSMATSLVYSAVMGAILSGLPGVSVKFVVFDTAVVDLSDRIGDPVDLLMSVQMGGGTDIAKALAHCEDKHVTVPARTILVLVSDFCEGGSRRDLVATTRRIASSGVKLLGLAALDEDCRPSYDAATAQLLGDAGMSISALTPDLLADWLAERIA